MSLQTLPANILGTALTGRGVIRAGEELQKYYQNEQKFNAVHSRNNLFDSQRLLPNLTDNIDVRRKDKKIALSNLST